MGQNDRGGMDAGESAWLASDDRVAVRRRTGRMAALVLVIGLSAVAGTQLWEDHAITRMLEARFRTEAADATVEDQETLVRKREGDVTEAQLEVDLLSADATPELVTARTDDLDRARSALAEAEREREERQAILDRRLDTAIRAVSSRQGAGNWANVTLGVVAFVTASVCAAGWATWVERRRTFLTRRAFDAIEAESRQREGQDPGGDGDPQAVAAWAANRARIEGYHRLVTEYASTTRQVTQVALIVGLVFVGGLAVLAVLTNDTPSAVATSAIGVAGTAFVGFVTNAILKNAEASSREVLAFFSHPLEVDRILRAERLVEGMPEDDRSAAKLAIVQALVAGDRRPPSPVSDPAHDS